MKKLKFYLFKTSFIKDLINNEDKLKNISKNQQLLADPKFIKTKLFLHPFILFLLVHGLFL